jgi:GntR family transcriptional regulator
LALRKPLYVEVAEKLAARIRSGQWELGARLPNEAALAEEQRVSRATLRDALSSLEREGLIRRRHGLGSFVSEHKGRIVAGIEKLASFTETIRRSGHNARQEVLSVEAVTLAEQMAEQLACTSGGAAIRVVTLRLADEVPVILTDDLIPEPLAPGPHEFHLLAKLGLLGFLAEKRRTEVAESFLSVSAVLPDERSASALKVGIINPVVALEGVAHDRHDRPLYHTRTLIRSDRYELTLVRRS